RNDQARPRWLSARARPPTTAPISISLSCGTRTKSPSAPAPRRTMTTISDVMTARWHNSKDELWTGRLPEVFHAKTIRHPETGEDVRVQVPSNAACKRLTYRAERRRIARALYRLNVKPRVG